MAKIAISPIDPIVEEVFWSGEGLVGYRPAAATSHSQSKPHQRGRGPSSSQAPGLWLNPQP
jgi:hypothetical protein